MHYASVRPSAVRSSFWPIEYKQTRRAKRGIALRELESARKATKRSFQSLRAL